MTALDPHQMKKLMAQMSNRFSFNAQLVADMKERDHRTWLRMWSGQQWGDEAPNRLFGSWLNQDGEAL